MATPAPNFPLQGYYQPVAPQQYAAAPVPAAQQAPQYAGDVRAFGAINNGPVVQTQALPLAGHIMRAFPAGTQAAIGAATAIAAKGGASYVKAVSNVIGNASEPLLRLSWDLASHTFGFIGNLLTFQIGGAMKSLGEIFRTGAVNTGGILKKVVEPVQLTAAVGAAPRLGPMSALATGVSVGFKALKSSFVWAIPAAAIGAFIDYKYKDQNDPKRLISNFAADVVGYTAGGMAGAAAGAFIGSMTLPVVGTIVGAGVGILLGMLHEKTTRPVISDTLRDMLG
jgi:hypothetical protein